MVVEFQEDYFNNQKLREDEHREIAKMLNDEMNCSTDKTKMNN